MRGRLIGGQFSRHWQRIIDIFISYQLLSKHVADWDCFDISGLESFHYKKTDVRNFYIRFFYETNYQAVFRGKNNLAILKKQYFIYTPEATNTINVINKTTKATAAGIHSGDNTHNHDQAITLVNFKAIKRIRRLEENANPI